MDLVNNMQAIRASSTKFESSFLDQGGAPLVPSDPVSYPVVAIKDPDGTTVNSGVGKPVGNGNYIYEWFAPADAILNPVDRQWTIEWFFVTDDGHNKSSVESFSVIDRISPQADERKWTYICRAGACERLLLPLREQQEEVRVDVLTPSKQLWFSVDRISKNIDDALKSTPLANRKICYSVDELGRYVYFIETDPLVSGEYLVFWDVRTTRVSPNEQIQQLLRVPELQFWYLAQPLRIFIDKLRKRIEWVQAYHASDIYEYIIRGLDMVNLVPPTTNWTLSGIPARGSRGVVDAVLLYAATWALIAQQAMEEELQFSAGDQTVTLEYKRDYGGVLGHIKELLENFKEGKKHIYLIANGPGRVGVRPKNWRFTQRVWRVDNWGSGMPYDVSTLLTSVGI